ncbi:MAG: FUSC family protein, partial [Acidobacteriota bacterium]|nr:FUSC family protein [Acidobacteriota bacterium]
FSRGVLRLCGTFAGLVIATALFHFLHTGLATDIALLGVFTFLLRWVGPANYGIFVTALSALIVLLLAPAGVPPHEVIVTRAINTGAGGLLAMIAYAVWPTWEKTQVGPALAETIEAYRVYFGAVIAALSGKGSGELDRDRSVGRRARSNAEASVDRLRGEPGAAPGMLDTLTAILVHSHSFVHAVMSLESGYYRTRPMAIRPATVEFAAQADICLAAIAAALRDRTPLPRNLPDLREAHNRILDTPGATGGRYTLVNVETDRIVTSLNTLLEQVAKL